MRLVAPAAALLAALALTSCGGGAAAPAAPSTQETAVEPYAGSYIETTNQPGEIDGFVGALADAEVTRCEQAADGWVAAGTVANPEPTPQSYRLFVAFNEGQDSRGLVQVDVEGVASGATEKWQVETPLTAEKLSCVLRVERYAP